MGCFILSLFLSFFVCLLLVDALWVILVACFWISWVDRSSCVDLFTELLCLVLWWCVDVVVAFFSGV